MADKCIEGTQKIYEELKKITEVLNKLDPEDPRSLYKFKPYYENLLNVLEESKSLASCDIPALKVDGECEYVSPLEPLTLAEYANLPAPDEGYTIIDKIRRYAKYGDLAKIQKTVNDIKERLEAVVYGLKECPIELDENVELSDEDINLMLKELEEEENASDNE